MIRQHGLVIVDAELLDLAGNGVAAHAEEIGGLDAPARGALERLGDERALELTRKSVEDPGFAARQTALGLLFERGEPVRARGGGLVAKLRRQVSGIDHLDRKSTR